MSVRPTSSFQIVFSPDARAELERLEPESRGRVLEACEALASLASVTTTSATPLGAPALPASVEGLEIVSEVVAEQQTVWIHRLVRAAQAG